MKAVEKGFCKPAAILANRSAGRRCVGWLIVGTLLCVPSTARGQLRAGAARIDITPPVGVALDGSISKNGVVTSVHDPLHARALVLDDGTTKIAMVVVDQCMTGRDVFDAAKDLISQAIGLAPNRMLMAATHTHAAPRTIHIGTDQVDEEYHRELGDRIARAVIAANENLAPARIGYGSFGKPDLIACRRFICDPGSVARNPFGVSGERIKSVAGKSTAIVGPAGPTDPQFSVLSVQHQDGTPLCLLGNFSVHYCGGYQRGAVSADYFGYFSSAIEAKLASQSAHPPVVGIMSNGTSGDTGAFQNRDGKKFAAFEAMQYYGRLLAEEATAVIAAMEHRSDVVIAMQERELELAVRRPDSERIAWARKVVENPQAKQPHRWTKTYAQEALHLAKYPATQVIKLQALRIGDIGIAAAPCEVFAETGLAIKKQSPIKHTFNMELANGYAGYLPTRQQHLWGGYETWPARSSLLEVAAEERIRAGLLQLLSEVQ